ncbi:hypothetical protein C5E02_03285 [Rathayibacter rathayi]|uniref:HNH endonuclease n=1 Tax=Rathayibacter rathayi TaxID=33887 RepID=A0ABD6WCD4_RATRA|nr:hypothetical protein C1O28_03485 [Rathayibacter rathayi]MWV74283.1 hypothetical protein [Rathayibacter rathayi NCPPB 2980 = VKM Ac-1601]PPF15972.1 hypothetical protein C5C04_01820 [Rathayibacter rathayi]PPF49310.1 hypothetical protein C5C08_07425 [Rathayibacter rathayi]PPG69794.1 hypothetical protein C5C16_05340 [Rathayibacter rathayi]
MTQQDPNRRTLRGDWWNDQASSVATNKYPTNVYSDERCHGCTMFLPARSFDHFLPTRHCDGDPHNLNDQISSWRMWSGRGGERSPDGAARQRWSRLGTRTLLLRTLARDRRGPAHRDARVGGSSAAGRVDRPRSRRTGLRGADIIRPRSR